MSGGLLLLSTSLLLLAAAVSATDDSKSAASPPKAPAKPIEEILHGTKIIDSYRWLEDGKTPETQKWTKPLANSMNPCSSFVSISKQSPPVLSGMGFRSNCMAGDSLAQ